jgi:hypothetical protein
MNLIQFEFNKLREFMKSLQNDIKEITKKAFDSINNDQEIENESYLLHYHNLLTENIRINNRQITRNSYLLVLSISLYFFIFFNESYISDISILFFKINDNTLLLNFIPIVFAFVYLRNITLWNNNINLIPLFESNSRKLFGLSLFTDTVNIIKPFSFLHHILNYQYENKKVKWIFKLPLSLTFLIFMLFPIFFNIFSIVIIAINNPPSIVSYFCAILIGIITLATIVQAFNSHKN